MKQKMMLLAVLIMILALIAAACSTGDSNKVDQTASPTPSTTADGEEALESPFEFSIMLATTPNNEPDALVAIMEEFTNTKMDVQWTPEFGDVLPVRLAAGDLADIIKVNDGNLRQPYVINAMRGGLFWDITDYITDYPNLMKIDPDVWDNNSLDGRYYGIPRERPRSRVAMSIRQDWLDNLGMSMPTTIDELYDVLYAFTYNDPDGNGEDDTIGLSEQGDASVNRWFSVLFGAPNGWKITDDGQFINAIETTEFMDALRFVKRLYDDGLVNQDFPVSTEWRGLFERDIAGTHIRHIDEAYYFSNLMPHADIGTLSQLEGPHGIRTPGEIGSNGVILFTKKGIETEEKLRRALQFFDDVAGEEMSNLLLYGIEGEHWVRENGKATVIDPVGYNLAAEMPRNQFATLHPTVNAIPENFSGLRAIGEPLKEDNLKYAVYNPTFRFVSPTLADRGSELNRIRNDAIVNFILGEIDEAGWHQQVENWKNAGGAQIAAEFAEEYAIINDQ